MSKICKRTTALALIITLVISAFACLSLGSGTVKAASYPTGYPNTYKNSGVGANDIIGVARTQIGYTENYYGTKYGYWYTPTFVNQPWCAMFVSWCANQAGIPNSVIPKFAACSIGINWFKNVNQWHDSKYYGGSYTPKKGDVIFYRDYGSTSLSTHVGLVAGLNGVYINAIEGNSTNSAVCEFTHNEARRIDSAYVIGYGTPTYSSKLENEPTTYEVWQVSTDSLNMRKTASATGTLVTSLPFGTSLKVKNFKVTDDYLWGHVSYSGKTGWVALNYCDYIYGNVNGAYYQLPPEISPKTNSLYIGETFRFTPTNALGAKYTVSDNTKAKVSAFGLFTALKAGTVTVTITTQTGSNQATIKVKNPVLSAKSANTCIGDKYQLSVNHTKLTPTWSSSDTSIAKVNSKGVVTGIKKGDVIITATVGDVKLHCNFKVTLYPRIYENFETARNTYLKNDKLGTKSIVKIPRGTKLKVSEVYYSDTYTYGKTTFNDKEGWVILNKCTYLNGIINGKTYLVRPYFGEKEKSIFIREEFNLNVIDATEPITYTSQDKTVARVINSSGKVRGLKQGTTTLTATIGETSLNFKVNVKNPVLNCSELDLVKGKKKRLTVTGGSGAIEWKSTDENVAKVSADGVVTATGYGEADITAARNGVTVQCHVKGYDPILNATYKAVRVDQVKKLRVRQSTGATVTWKSSNPSLVRVSKSGAYRGLKPGTAYITATVDGVTLKCEIKIIEA